jgi:type II secretory pathway component PulJ
MRADPRFPLRHAAFTLFEMLVYITLLAVLIGIGYKVFFESIASSLAFRRSADDIVKVLHAGELWRSDIRACTEVRLETRPAEQILRLQGAREEVTYQLSTNCIYRSVVGGRTTPLLVNVKSARFIEDPRRTVTAWRWELELQTRSRQPGIVRPLFTFIGVPAAHQPP